jgi:putative ABC transport system ATP-binding protein
VANNGKPANVTTAPLIVVRDLSKTYGVGSVPVQALRDVSLTVQRGEFVAVMGPSGSGKSTFMNLLGCLDQPTSGSYALAGKDVARLSNDELADVRGKMIGFVFQGFNLLARANAAENVELPLLYAGASHEERERRVQDALSAVGLADRARHLPSELSGGQQQRVAIARALVNNPLLVLADEPTGNLDSKSSVEIMRLFEALNADRAITLVIVTHDPNVAGWAHRVVTFSDGCIVEDRATPRARAQATS